MGLQAIQNFRLDLVRTCNSNSSGALLGVGVEELDGVLDSGVDGWEVEADVSSDELLATLDAVFMAEGRGQGKRRHELVCSDEAGL
jgi:hypothetical protein